MTTAIAVYNSEGCVGRCDANCHNAKTAECTCICGGRLHGAGRGGGNAIEKNTRDLFGGPLADTLKAAFCERNDLDPADCRIEFPQELAQAEMAL